MKSILLLLMFAIPTGESIDDMAKISAAIKAGDARALSVFLNDDVEIAILDDEDYYTKEEALNVLEDFFETHTTKGFELMHKGSSNSEGSKYCIGNLATVKGKFRVYIYLSKTDAALKIHELRFEKS